MFKYKQKNHASNVQKHINLKSLNLWVHENVFENSIITF